METPSTLTFSHGDPLIVKIAHTNPLNYMKWKLASFVNGMRRNDYSTPNKLPTLTPHL